jgi:stromal membrane-associated protein
MADKEQAALRARLDSVLKRPENQTCADCRGRMPRWASTNLGIFVCTSCSGIHRGLGVHISKVRSVALDKWTLELVDGMVGNAQANAFWEGGKPPGQYDRPSEGDMQRLNQFIRDKYERQLYADKSRQPPRLSAGAPAAPVAASLAQPPPRYSGAPVTAAAPSLAQPPPLPRKPLPPAPGAVAGAADLLSGLQVSSQAHKSRTTADALDELAGFVQAPTAVHASASCPVLPNEAQNWLSEAYGGGYQSGFQAGSGRSSYQQHQTPQQPQGFLAGGVGQGAFSFAPPPGPGRPVMRPPGPM